MTDKQVRSDEARRGLRDLIDEVGHGAHITILRYDKPAAVLVSPEWYAQAQALSKVVKGSVLITYDSTDHTAFRSSASSCLTKPVVTYLVTLSPPPQGLHCSP